MTTLPIRVDKIKIVTTLNLDEDLGNHHPCSAGENMK